MANSRRVNGASIAILAVAALAGVGAARKARKGHKGSRALGRKIDWDPRRCMITAEMFFEDYNAEEDRDQAIEEDRPIDPAVYGMFSPGLIEYASFGKKKTTSAPFRGDLDWEKVHKFFIAAGKKLGEDLQLQGLRLGSYDDQHNLEILIGDEDAPRIIRLVSETDLARHERSDAEDYELEPIPFFRVRDWRFYPYGFGGANDHIPLFNIEVVGVDLYIKKEEEED
jgi:hypothetical protein